MQGSRAEEKEIGQRTEWGLKSFPYKEWNGTGHFRWGVWNEQTPQE